MIKIGENIFDVPAPPAMRSFSLQQRILPVAGRVANVLLVLIGGDVSIEKLADADVFKVLPLALPAVGEIFAAMPPGELEAVTRALLCDATCKVGTAKKLPLFSGPGGDTFDAIMAGRTMDTWQLLWHALGIRYPDFFVRALALRASGGKKASPSEESSTSEPSGPAGASG